MSHYTIFIHCDDCHAVLAPIRDWDTPHAGKSDRSLALEVDRAAKAHEVGCPCAPLRDRPAGEPRE